MSARALVKGLAITLGDGATYMVPPLTLGSLELLQDRLHAKHDNALDPAYIATVIDAAHAALRRNYPEMTREQVGELIDLENMPEVYQAVLDVSGLLRKQREGEVKNAQASQTAAPTGSPSSST